jgi:hypothetical protein
MFAASIAQPLLKEKAEELWETAKEMNKKRLDNAGIIDKTNYGLYFKKNMVCSEAARWVLVKIGRNAPETRSKTKKWLGRIDFGPADFFAEQPYFLITPLAPVKKKEATDE